MKESYGEGPATHTGPESCAAVREALTEIPPHREGLDTGQKLGPPQKPEMDRERTPAWKLAEG